MSGSFVRDNFSGTAGTELSTHTSTSGHAWARAFSPTFTMQLDGSGRIASTANGGWYTISGTPATRNYTVAATVLVASTLGTSDQIGIVSCAHASAGTCYIGYYDPNLSKWGIVKWVTGTFTVLVQSSTATLTVNSSYTLALTTTAVGITLNVDGVNVCSHTDTTISPTMANCLAGVYANHPTAGTGFKLLAFSASDEIALAYTDLFDNNYSDSVGGNYTRSSEFAFARFTTDATGVTINCYKESHPCILEISFAPTSVCL